MDSWRAEVMGTQERLRATRAAYIASAALEHAGSAASAPQKSLLAAKAEKAAASGPEAEMLPNPYITTLSTQLKLLMLRRARILRGAWVAVLVELSSFVILAIIVGTSYLRLRVDTESFFSRESVIFLCVLLRCLAFVVR